MAQMPCKDLDYPPTLSKRFTAFGTTIVLQGATGQTAGTAPTQNNNLPCQVLIEHIAAAVFAYTDGFGVTNSITFPVSGITIIRMAPYTIETSTTVTAATVWWQSGPV